MLALQIFAWISYCCISLAAGLTIYEFVMNHVRRPTKKPSTPAVDKKPEEGETHD